MSGYFVLKIKQDSELFIIFIILFLETTHNESKTVNFVNRFPSKTRTNEMVLYTHLTGCTICKTKKNSTGRACASTSIFLKGGQFVTSLYQINISLLLQ